MWITVLKYLLLLTGGAPLIIYPAAMIASVMGLAGHVPSGTPTWQLLMAYSFHIGVLIYPAVFIIAGLWAVKASDLAGVYWAIAPMGYMGVLFVLFRYVLS